MKRMMIVCVIALGLLGCSPSRQESSGSSTIQNVISADDAIRLSRQACAGKADIPSDAKAVVTETNGQFVVTFPQPLQPDTLHGDFYARVTIHKATGQIKEILLSQ